MDDHDIDAVVETGERLTRIAVEATRCYRGDRASGEARAKEQQWDKFCAWLREATMECLGNQGYFVTFKIYLPDTMIAAAPRMRSFLATSEGQEPTTTAIQDALRRTQRDGFTVRIGEAGAQADSSLFHPASQVHVVPIAPTDPTEVTVQFRESSSPGEWHYVMPLSSGVNTQGIVDAIVDERASIPRYRAASNACQCKALWLLLVVEESVWWDVHAALSVGRDALRAALATEPTFDEVYILFKASGVPAGWSLRDGLPDASPVWQLHRLWPEKDKDLRTPC